MEGTSLHDAITRRARKLANVNGNETSPENVQKRDAPSGLVRLGRPGSHATSRLKRISSAEMKRQNMSRFAERFTKSCVNLDEFPERMKLLIHSIQDFNRLFTGKSFIHAPRCGDSPLRSRAAYRWGLPNFTIDPADSSEARALPVSFSECYYHTALLDGPPFSD